MSETTHPARGEAGPSAAAGAIRLPPHWRRWTLASVAVLVASVIVLREPLADRLWPEARAHALADRAAQALAHGRLTAADGSGARELYEAALAIDPDDGDARAGLGLVAQVALAQARTATAVDDYAHAHQALALARALSIPRAQADVVDAELRLREARRTGIENLLAQAATARRSHRLDGAPDAALPLYARILAFQPDRIEALEGREDALADLLQQARLDLQRGRIAEAARLVASARGYDAGHADLPDTQAALSKAIDDLRAAAERDLRQQQLDRAVGRFEQLLEIDAEDAGARNGMERVATVWARRAQRLGADFRFVDAGAALARARRIAPESSAVRDAEQAIAHARQSRNRLTIPGTAAGRARRVRTLIAEAAMAQARGDLLTPPGDSAFDKLRAARAIAPDDPGVRRAGAQLLPAARECFETALRGNDLGGARACLDARVALEGEGSAVAAARRRLAQRWLSVGEERLRAGALQPAQRALDSARAVDPATPGIDDFAARLATATGR
ncbi:MAG: hypothetical protein ACJ8GK_07830 [Luteimonas sp.]